MHVESWGNSKNQFKPDPHTPSPSQVDCSSVLIRRAILPTAEQSRADDSQRKPQILGSTRDHIQSTKQILVDRTRSMADKTIKKKQKKSRISLHERKQKAWLRLVYRKKKNGRIKESCRQENVTKLSRSRRQRNKGSCCCCCSACKFCSSLITLLSLTHTKYFFPVVVGLFIYTI